MLPDETNTFEEEMEVQPHKRNSKDSSKVNGSAVESNSVLKERNGGVRHGTVAESSNCMEEKKKYYFGQPLIWRNIIAISLYHVGVVYAYLTFPYFQRPLTFLWGAVYAVINSFGVGAGVHRLWTHRTYKAKTPLRVILLCCYSGAGMNPIYDWVRDHRIHHKYSETDGDPHNSNRGFFFSHVGWLMMRKHPEVIQKGRQIDMSDIVEDPVVAFGEKYFLPLKIFFCFVLPITVPVYFWQEQWYYAILSQVFMRYAFVLNVTWSVNSVAHMFGWRPYDSSIAPVENKLVSMVTGGEGWHNYHHVFPWDYKAAEIGHPRIDLSTVFIETFAKIGWAYDLKEPSPDLVRAVVTKKGDGTHVEVQTPPAAVH